MLISKFEITENVLNNKIISYARKRKADGEDL